jgi:hypothetical protein
MKHPYACMRGIIEKVAGLTVKEPVGGAGTLSPAVESLQTRTSCLWSDQRAIRPPNETATFSTPVRSDGYTDLD